MRTATYNYCLLVPKLKHATSIIDIVVQQFFKASNLPRNGCPVPPKIYFLNGVKLDGSNLTSLVPSGLYFSIINMMILENNKKIIFFKISIELNVFESL